MKFNIEIDMSKCTYEYDTNWERTYPNSMHYRIAMPSVDYGIYHHDRIIQIGYDNIKDKKYCLNSINKLIPDIDMSLITTNIKCFSLPELIMLKVAKLFNDKMNQQIFDYNDIFDADLYNKGEYKHYTGRPITWDLDHIEEDTHTQEAFTKVYNQLKQYIADWICKNDTKVIANIPQINLERLVVNDNQQLDLEINEYISLLMKYKFRDIYDSNNDSYVDISDMFNTIGCNIPYIDHTGIISVAITNYNLINQDNQYNEEFREKELKLWHDLDEKIANLYYNKWISWVGQIISKLYYDAINECLKIHYTTVNGSAVDPDAVKNLVTYDSDYVQQLLDQKAIQQQIALQQQQLAMQQAYQEEIAAQSGYDGNLFRDQPTPIDMSSLVQQQNNIPPINTDPYQQMTEEVAVTDEQTIHTTHPVMSMEEAFDKYKNLDETNKHIVDLFIQTLVS